VLFIGLGGGGGLLLKEPTSEISGEQLTERLNLFPNEGIRRSAKNGLFVWLIIGPFVALLVGLFFGLVQVPIFGLFEGLFDGLFFGLLAGLYFGLGAFIQHYVLRFWLWRADVFPWNAVRFLDDATARILLRRLGGGYSFAHRLLLDYFADLDTKAASNSSKID